MAFSLIQELILHVDPIDHLVLDVQVILISLIWGKHRFLIWAFFFYLQELVLRLPKHLYILKLHWYLRFQHQLLLFQLLDLLRQLVFTVVINFFHFVQVWFPDITAWLINKVIIPLRCFQNRFLFHQIHIHIYLQWLICLLQLNVNLQFKFII